MRLVQIIAGAPHGGAEAFFVRLAIALRAAGIDQKLVIRRDAARAATLAAAGLAPLELAFGRFFDWSSRRAIRQLLGDFQPDVVMTWMSRATTTTPSGPYKLVGRLGGYYNPRYFRHCDALIANTESLRGWLIGKGFSADSVYHLPNFIDSRPQPPVDRASLATPADAPLLLGLGRLHTEKGFDVALDALAGLPGVYLWLAGEGPERAQLESQVARLGIADRVRFLGWRGDIPALLATADIMICPSRLEPLGNIVLEAWAHGCPVVAAASPGPAELIREAEDGLLVPIADAPALRAALARVLADGALKQALAAAGRQRAAEFSEPASVQRYIACLQGILTSCAA